MPRLHDLLNWCLKQMYTCRFAVVKWPQDTDDCTQTHIMLMSPPLWLLLKMLVAFYTGRLWRILTASPLLLLPLPLFPSPLICHAEGVSAANGQNAIWCIGFGIWINLKDRWWGFHCLSNHNCIDWDMNVQVQFKVVINCEFKQN